MKISFLTLFILGAQILFAQSIKIEIDWQKINDEVSSESAFGYNYDPLSNSYAHTWKDSFAIDEASVSIESVTYTPIQKNQLLHYEHKNIPEKITYSVSSNFARNELYNTLSFAPIVNVNGVLNKVSAIEFSFSPTSPSPFQKNTSLSNSLLAQGNWYQFRVENEGIHRIDRNFLSRLGIDVNSIDPRKIKIYGNGSQMLPLRNSDNQHFDLVENSIYVSGEENGVFNANDYILFYADVNSFSPENNSHINKYTDHFYYYITTDGANGLRISEHQNPTDAPNYTINQYNHYSFFEKDEVNPAIIGRKWFSNRFDINNEQTFSFNIPNRITSEPIDVRVFSLAVAEVTTFMEVFVNDVLQHTKQYGIIGSTVLGSGRSYVGNVTTASENVEVTLKYNNAGRPQSNAFLDYISINALAQLSGTGSQFSFQYDQAPNISGVGLFEFSNASQYSQIWDVTNPSAIQYIENTSGTSISFTAPLGELRKYVAVHTSDYHRPIAVNPSQIANQNLKGTIFNDENGNFQDIDYLIVAPPQFIQPALRLANHHRSRNNLSVRVVTTDKIYNEFSHGKQDIAAIRNFIKYIYDNASTPQNRIKYVNLFGDTSVDYKNRLQNNNNIVPTFHLSSFNTLSASGTYMSDDFFGMMDANEGTMAASDKLDLAVGRMLADNPAQANAMVSKVIRYESEAALGNWRNNFVLISDDADNFPTDFNLQVDLDNLGETISENQPFVNVIKIHSDAFQQETSSGGNRYPKVNEAIENAFDAGALVINYFGHGGEVGLASERIYTIEMAQNLKNRNKMPLMVTITCEFTRFDNPLRPTAGEYTYWNQEGGAIALITTTRQIGVTTGKRFNDTLAAKLYAFDLDNFIPPAEAVRVSKNEMATAQRRVIFYVGDPAMHLAFPKKEVQLTSLNGQPLGPTNDTLKALSRIRLGGQVVDPQGNLVTNYQGVLEARVFDKRLQRSTLGNDGTTDNSGNLAIMDFETLGETIFNGQASIVNGQFEFEFIVPRDIAVPVGEGRVSLYARRDGSFEDQAGANETIKVGGVNLNAPQDNVGPTIRLYMNDESFVNGGTTNNSPLLIAKLEDESGINTASGIGHDITAILNGDETNPIILNSYYLADVDDFTKGSLSYRLRNLEEGLHTLTLKAWDVYNNSSTADIQFVVAGSNELVIERVLNYPNPFIDYTEFWFNHNRPFEPLEVQVQVFTVTGKVVWSHNQIINTDGFLSREITWDGRDDFGDRIGKGVYVYKLTVRSTLTNKKVEKFEKLVIL